MDRGRVTIDPIRMRGLPCIRDTRVTVASVLGSLAAGLGVDDVIDDFPYLDRSDVDAALEFAAAEDPDASLAAPL